MDVDALSQKGGKGKDGKSCKHNQEASKDKDKENSFKFAGKYWIRGKTGRKPSECWHKEKVKGKDGKGGKNSLKERERAKKRTNSLEENEEQHFADAGLLEFPPSLLLHL
eukprot:2704191-Amphidinium_carterae.2